jgi:PTH1 family peptidyl-tRNA hydrolase
LGNAKGSYELTPHNVGFDAVFAAARALGLELRDVKGQVTAAQSDDGLVFAAPQSFMNTSGPHVAWAQRHWNVTPSQTLIVCDDFTLPWGRLRIRRSGSSGGHNGLKSVIEAVGHQDFPRLRVGVGPVPEGMDPKDYVLKRVPKAKLSALADWAAQAIAAIAKDGLEAAMNVYNQAQEGKP